MKKLVQNRNLVFHVDAEINTILMLVSFAASVTFTRAFLYLTGYPQIGNDELHISHILWGGLLMFAALLLLMLYGNRWIQTLAAIMSGIGIGFFIDEVGKFITQTNDYFYPAAAPIIYSFFLLTIIVLMIAQKRKKPDTRKTMYEVLDHLDDYLDHSLSAKESETLLRKVDTVAELDGDEDIKQLAAALSTVLNSQNLTHPPRKILFIERIESFFNEKLLKALTRKRARILLAAAWIAWGIWSLLSPLKVILNRRNEEALLSIIDSMVDAHLIDAAITQSLFQLRILLSLSLGILIILAAIILLLKKDRIAAYVAFWTLLISITVSNLLLFYFDQFSTIFNAAVQFFLLFTLIAYQRKYLRGDSATI
jgi:hypothetical protein